MHRLLLKYSTFGQVKKVGHHENDLVAIFSTVNGCNFLDDNYPNRTAIARGFDWNHFLSIGYLRHYGINPTDISSIIAHYVANDKGTIKFQINNNHNDIMILFPTRSDISINMKNMSLYTNYYECSDDSCIKLFRYHFGIIGIKKCKITKFKNKGHLSLDSIYSAMQIGLLDLESERFANKSTNFENLITKLSATSDIDKDDIDIIDCSLMVTSRLQSIITFGKGARYPSGYNLRSTSFINRTRLEDFTLKDCTFILRIDKGNHFCVEYKVRDKNSQHFVIKKNIERVLLKRDYNYVVACCFRGCDKPISDRKRLFTISVA